MKEKEIYLAGGCYWGVEKYVSQIKGVTSTRVGFANGNTIAPKSSKVFGQKSRWILSCAF